MIFEVVVKILWIITGVNPVYVLRKFGKKCKILESRNFLSCIWGTKVWKETILLQSPIENIRSECETAGRWFLFVISVINFRITGQGCRLIQVSLIDRHYWDRHQVISYRPEKCQIVFEVIKLHPAILQSCCHRCLQVKRYLVKKADPSWFLAQCLSR